MIKKDHLILIVDDAPANLQVLGSILSEQGYQIILADNGLQALKSIEKFSPDLILLDVNMPGMNGFETCQRLKELEKTAETPIIFLTARTSPDDILDAFSAGASDQREGGHHGKDGFHGVRSRSKDAAVSAAHVTSA